MARGQNSPFQGHPNSIQAKVNRDPAMKAKMKANRKQFIADASSLEVWYTHGCSAASQIDYRDYDLG